MKEELGWCPYTLTYLNKVKNELANCDVTHYIAKLNINADQLHLEEGQAMGWFTLKEILKIDNKPVEVENAIIRASNLIKSL